MKNYKLTNLELEKNNLIRKEKYKLRNELNQEEYKALNNSIYKNFFNFLKCKNIKHVSAYWSTGNEADTIEIITELFNQNIEVSLPQVVGKKRMIFRQIKSLNFDYEYFKNIKQPNKENLKIKSSVIDLILVPLLSYNDDYYRLGYGLGYYDRFLNKNSKNNKLIKIGLAYQFQKNNSFFINKYDKKLDFIINENGVI
ncbi:5-formyltetrahydrofolate cyclo-ligase [Mycoplasmoides pirum]|uniref:5-formyltetrahydrofolate cyclo-ligase n=1 Tax=Mycoplasmoides pirum TaxID=2122 RepID=UPI0004882039|nr:5-formyltetrahydrofolate cyclo-ligase [Mycoplasmoides pirum]